MIGAPAVAGTIVDGEFQAQYTGASRVAASWQNLADTSDLIYVLPGVFSYLWMEGGTLSTVAGQAWPDGEADVVVTAHDVFGNLIQDFEGEVYFECTDPLAVLPATVSDPYLFVPSDLGRRVFAGSTFRLLTAGRQDLR